MDLPSRGGRAPGSQANGSFPKGTGRLSEKSPAGGAVPPAKSAQGDRRRSQRLVQQPPVLIILCILCIDVPFIVLLDGSAQSRGAGARLAGKREFPKGDRPAFREVARRIPPTSPSGRHPRERGRPARMLSLRLPLSFPAMLQPTALPAGTAWARPKQRQGAAAG